MKNPLSIISLSVLVVAAGLSLTSCKKDYSAEDVVIPPTPKDHNLVLRFKALVDTNELEFGANYRNFFKETYSVKTFKYYVHGIELINTDSNKVFRTSADKYFLVDFSDSNTTVLKLAVLPYKYNRISFTIEYNFTL